jgi:hypothetical protein
MPTGPSAWPEPPQQHGVPAARELLAGAAAMVEPGMGARRASSRGRSLRRTRSCLTIMEITTSLKMPVRLRCRSVYGL